MKKVLQAILVVLGNKDAMVQGANICDKAYSIGTGNPDWYSSFTAEKPEKVAMNVAGIQAVISGIGAIATLRGAENLEAVEDLAMDVLSDIANNNLNYVERSIMLRLANCAWGAGQAFRSDKGPLGRMKNMNVFDLLDPNEVAKDLHQITAAAQFLIGQINC